MNKLSIIILATLCLSSCQQVPGIAGQSINVDKLANAIFKAEHSKTHPYGIMTRYKHTTPRQACINTINHRFKAWSGKGDFISYLGSSYAPVGALNDPKNLNINWVSNVHYYYERSMRL